MHLWDAVLELTVACVDSMVKIDVTQHFVVKRWHNVTLQQLM